MCKVMVALELERCNVAMFSLAFPCDENIPKSKHCCADAQLLGGNKQ